MWKEDRSSEKNDEQPRNKYIGSFHDRSGSGRSGLFKAKTQQRSSKLGTVKSPVLFLQVIKEPIGIDFFPANSLDKGIHAAICPSPRPNVFGEPGVELREVAGKYLGRQVRDFLGSLTIKHGS